MSVKRLEDGRIECNGIILESNMALEISQFIDREFHVEDIKSTLKTEYPELNVDTNEDLVDKIVDDYEHSLGNDDGWTYSVDYAIGEHKEEIKKAISAERNRSDNNKEY